MLLCLLSIFIDSFDYIFKGMILRKYTHNLTFSVAKYSKNLFSRYLLPLNYVKTSLADMVDKYCIA